MLHPMTPPRDETLPPPRAPADPGRIAHASVRETLGVIADVIAPTIGKGVLIRRPRIVGLAERFGLDDRAVRRLQRLRDVHGSGPVVLAVPGRTFALILAPEHVERVLAETPEPFSPATVEKRAALAHFEPAVSLISEGSDRVTRRAFNETILESERPLHTLSRTIAAVVEEEASALLAWAGAQLTWRDFSDAWRRAVRRVVLGDGARDDSELTELLAKLRAAGNWAMFHPGRRRLAQQFRDRLDVHLRRAEPGSLAATIAASQASERTEPADQVAHWLFAFDPAGMATYRALALLAAHPDEFARAAESARAGADLVGEHPRLRAALLESLRLWPTTPVILRETTTVTQWPGGELPRGASLIIYAPFFHRDRAMLPDADRFRPDLWRGTASPGGRFVQFSQGPGICPGRHVVLMMGSIMLAVLIRACDVALAAPERLDPQRSMPGTLDQTTLELRLHRRSGGASSAAFAPPP